MAQTVTLKVLPRNAVVSQSDYNWLQQHINTPLPLFQITFDQFGEVATMAVHAKDSCISIFVVSGTEFKIELPPTIYKYTNTHMAIHVVCRICGTKHTLRVPVSGMQKWKSGVAIQYALPELSEDERELLLSGVCPACWEGLQ